MEDFSLLNTIGRHSLKQSVIMAFTKIVGTNSIGIVLCCQSIFCFQSVREQVLKHKITFLVKLYRYQNTFCLSANRVYNEL